MLEKFRYSTPIIYIVSLFIHTEGRLNPDPWVLLQPALAVYYTMLHNMYKKVTSSIKIFILCYLGTNELIPVGIFEAA